MQERIDHRDRDGCVDGANQLCDGCLTCDDRAFVARVEAISIPEDHDIRMMLGQPKTRIVGLSKSLAVVANADEQRVGVWGPGPMMYGRRHRGEHATHAGGPQDFGPTEGLHHGRVVVRGSGGCIFVWRLRSVITRAGRAWQVTQAAKGI